MKLIVATLVFLLSFNLYAYNTEYSALLEGKKIFIDVANKDTVSLTLETASSDSSAKPQVKILKQWGDFSCHYRQTLILFSGFDFSAKTFHFKWEIQINWEPGADLSGCLVEIQFPGMKNSQAELFMNY